MSGNQNRFSLVLALRPDFGATLGMILVGHDPVEPGARMRRIGDGDHRALAALDRRGQVDGHDAAIVLERERAARAVGDGGHRQLARVQLERLERRDRDAGERGRAFDGLLREIEAHLELAMDQVEAPSRRLVQVALGLIGGGEDGRNGDEREDQGKGKVRGVRHGGSSGEVVEPPTIGSVAPPVNENARASRCRLRSAWTLAGTLC
mgnify:CR=1 FL=1